MIWTDVAVASDAWSGGGDFIFILADEALVFPALWTPQDDQNDTWSDA